LGFFSAIIMALMTIHYRHRIGPDGITYLDMAGAYVRGDWVAAQTLAYSPLYPWLLALAIRLARPTPYYEFFLLHIVNAFVFVGALAAFRYFFNGLLRSRPAIVAGEREDGRQGGALPDWVLTIVAYTLFAWTTLFWVGGQSPTPDLCETALLYLIFGLMLRMKSGDARWRTYLLFGFSLAFAFFARQFMLPAAAMFLAVNLVSTWGQGKTVRKHLGAATVFVVVIVPFGVMLSSATGRWTLGEVGKWNYKIKTGEVRDRYFSGGPRPPSLGVLSPEHRLKEYGLLGQSTYPRHYDPIAVHPVDPLVFEWRVQWALLRNTVKDLVGYLSRREILFFAGAAGGVLLLAGVPLSVQLAGIARQGVLWFPGAVVVGLYLLVFIEPRFLGGYFESFWLGIYSGIAVGTRPSLRQRAVTVLLAGMAFVWMAMAVRSLPFVRSVAEFVREGDRPGDHPHGQIALRVRELGFRPGDRIGYIGDTPRAFWIKIAGLKVVADVWYWGDLDPVEAESYLDNEKIMDVFRRQGAKLIATNLKPGSTAPSPKWERLGDSQYYIHVCPG